jgi:hypothetical protein
MFNVPVRPKKIDVMGRDGALLVFSVRNFPKGLSRWLPDSDSPLSAMCA